MARKREARAPRVPRGRAAPASQGEARIVPGSGGETPAVAPGGPRNIGFEEFHSYVKRDLARIGIFGTLIFAGMLVLKFVVGL